jgi:hypothetical protein
MTKIIIFSLAILTMIFRIEVFSQFENVKANILVGYTRNFISFNFPHEGKYEFNPELQIEGAIITDVLNWSVNLSYWDDNVSDLRGVMDLTTFYSYSDVSLGARIYFLSDSFTEDLSLLELAFFLGISHDFIKGENILSNENSSDQDISLGLNVGETGLRIGYELTPKIKMLGEYSFKYHLNSTDYLLCDARNSFKIGRSYLF